MKTIKPQKLGVLTKTIENGEACHFTVSVLVFFSFTPPSALLAEVDLWKFAVTELGDEPLDMAMPKLCGEVIVTGSAFPFGGPRAACAPRIAIGSVDKTLYVAGDRFWKGGSPSAPIPFTEMAIDHEHAFGGTGYAPNPLGKGLLPIQTEHGVVHPLPNIEDPKHLTGSPTDRPAVPAGFGPYDFTSPQRFSKVGTYDAVWLKERFPGFAADMDWAIWNSAPIDQQIAGYFSGDEAFVVEYMHPEKARIEGRLPGVRARAFVTQKTDSGERFRELPTRLDTVRLFPHAERGILVFRGMVDVVEDDAADILHLVLGCEDMGEAKPIGHYSDVLAQRLDREKGYLCGLRDSDLMPAKGRATDAPADDVAEMSALVATDGLLRKHMRRRMEREYEKTKKAMTERGLDPINLPPLPPEEPAPDMDDLAGVVERITTQAEEAKAKAENKQAAAEQAMRATCAAKGVDYDQMMRDTRAKAGGPPEPMWPKIARMRETSREAKARGISAPELDALLADPNLEERTRVADKSLRDAYQKFAHLYLAAAQLDGDEAVRVRHHVAMSHSARKSFAGCDLTGADLSGLNLTKADFSGALLECTDFTGAELGGVDFTGAVLTRANLTRANLFAAKLTGANLGSAILKYAEVGGGVDLTGAVMTKADLTGARFGGAQMMGVDLSEAILVGTDFSRIQAVGVNFIKTELHGVKLDGADLSKCNFIESTIAKTDFTGAKLVSTVFVTAKGDGAVFRDAILTNLRGVQESSFAGANFAGAHLEGANLRGTKLMGSDFSGAHLDAADLSECDLRSASFYRSTAKATQFVRTDLTHADMRSMNLMEGSLQKANLIGADLRGANLFRVDFAKAHTDGTTNVSDANMKRARFVPNRRGPNAAR